MKENFCFSIDEDANVVIEKIQNPRQTRIVNRLIKVTLDNGQTIKCTEDHIFYTRDNKEGMAKDLGIGQSLMPFYVDVAKNVDLSKRTYKNKKLKLEDYAVVYNPNTNLYAYVHHLSDDVISEP